MNRGAHMKRAAMRHMFNNGTSKGYSKVIRTWQNSSRNSTQCSTRMNESKYWKRTRKKSEEKGKERDEKEKHKKIEIWWMTVSIKNKFETFFFLLRFGCVNKPNNILYFSRLSWGAFIPFVRFSRFLFLFCRVLLFRTIVLYRWRLTIDADGKR